MAQDTYDDALRVRIDEQKQIITDVVSPSLKYEGRSYHFAAETDAVWQIKRIVTTGSITKVQFADGARYTQIWANRASLADFTSYFKNNKSVAFDGVNDYAYISHNSRIDFSHTSPWSWSSWIKTTDTGAKSILYKRDATANLRGYSLAKTAGGELTLVLQNGAGNLIQVTSTAAAIAAGTWKNIVVTYSGSGTAAGVKIYVVNTALALTTNTDALSATIANTSDQYLCATNPGNAANLYGRLDEVSMWSKELSAAEVSELYNSGTPSDLSTHSAVDNLVYWLRCGDGDTYPIIQDVAATHNCTMVNMTVYDIVSDAP